MKRYSLMLSFVFLLSAFCLLPSEVRAQGEVHINTGAKVPSKCTPKAKNGLFYKNSGANIGLHECTATDVWTFRGSLSFGGALTPAALSGDVNNYNPTGLGSSFAIRIDGGASDRNITGLATGSDGRLVEIINIGSTNTLTLVNQSSSSTAANRMLFGADVVIGINQSVVMRYDGTTARWRPFTQVLTSSGATAGSYGPSTITVDAAGRVTAAAASTANAIATPLTCTDAGANDSYTCTVTPTPSLTGLTLIFTPGTSNTGAATLNASSLGVMNIKKLVGASVSDPADGDLRAGGRYFLSYDGTQFLIMSTLGNAVAGVSAAATLTWTGAHTWNITASPALTVNGAITASANFGRVSIGAGGFAGSAGHFAGTGGGTSLALNEVSGFGGDLIRAQVNGVNKFILTSSGGLTLANGISTTGGTLDLNGSGVVFFSPSAGVLRFTDSSGANSALLAFGTGDSSHVALKGNGPTLEVKLGNDAAGGALSASAYQTITNCADSAGAAACGSAAAGAVVIDAAGSTVVVSTTVVTATSRIFIQEDPSLATELGITCNTTTGRIYTVTARTAGTSFTITSSAAPTTNPACLSYHIIN